MKKQKITDKAQKHIGLSNTAKYSDFKLLIQPGRPSLWIFKHNNRIRKKEVTVFSA